jgi:CRISPR-associated exonuclease Cas4
MAVPLLVGALLLVAAAVTLLLLSARMRRSSGLPAGHVLSSDMAPGRRGKTLYSPRYGLSGSPDYIVSTPQGLVPVEVKPNRNDPEPRDHHLLQVLAYCLLLEETEGKKPPYGLLRYKSNTFKVDYNADTRAYLLDVLDEMRAAEQQIEVHRSHDIPGRCRACGYRSVCEESLWPET